MSIKDRMSKSAGKSSAPIVRIVKACCITALRIFREPLILGIVTWDSALCIKKGIH